MVLAFAVCDKKWHGTFLYVDPELAKELADVRRVLQVAPLAFTGRWGIGAFFGVDGMPSVPDLVRKHGRIPVSSPARERLQSPLICANSGSLSEPRRQDRTRLPYCRGLLSASYRNWRLTSKCPSITWLAARLLLSASRRTTSHRFGCLVVAKAPAIPSLRSAMRAVGSGSRKMIFAPNAR